MTWWFLAFLLFAATVAIELPASSVLALPGADGTGTAFGDVRGPWWQGRAAGVRWQERELGNLSWDLHPQALLRGRVAMDLRLAGEVPVEARLVRGLRRTEVRDLRATLPTAWFGAMAAMLPQGRVRASVPGSIDLARWRIAPVSGELAWESGVSRQGTASVAGDFTSDPAQCRIRLLLRASDAQGRQLLREIGQALPDGRRLLVVPWPRSAGCAGRAE